MRGTAKHGQCFRMLPRFIKSQMDPKADIELIIWLGQSAISISDSHVLSLKAIRKHVWERPGYPTEAFPPKARHQRNQKLMFAQIYEAHTVHLTALIDPNKIPIKHVTVHVRAL